MSGHRRPIGSNANRQFLCIRLTLLVVALSLLSVATAHIAKDGSSRLKTMFNSLLDRFHANPNSIKKFFGGTQTLHIARVGPTNTTLQLGVPDVGYVPWAPEYDLYVDGVYQSKADPTTFQKISLVFSEDKTGTSAAENNIDDISESQICEFVADGGQYKFVVKDPASGEVVVSRDLRVFSSKGNFTHSTCSSGELHIVWDISGERPVEVARLKCINQLRWMSKFSRHQSCWRYASGRVSTVDSFYSNYELVGERERLHEGACSEQDIFSYSRDVRKDGKLPFNIHVKASYAYEPHTVPCGVDIDGEYELDITSGVSYWYRKGPKDPSGFNLFMDYYWDWLHVVDGNGNTVKIYRTPDEYSLNWPRCLSGWRSFLWDSYESREVARVWCGPNEKTRASMDTSTASCQRFASGRVESFKHSEEERQMRKFFPQMLKIHDGLCSPEEATVKAAADVVGTVDVTFVVVITTLCCCLVCALVTVLAYYCFYNKVVPISSRRRAGFKPMPGATVTSECDREEREEGNAANHPPWNGSVAVMGRMPSSDGQSQFS
eukprot:GHVQ01027236.1.p1 GENE.GHVQ01027236.1~~GHVQ01027236.1.p1  ORF type:complete len:549 (-),score=40.88 GHVQ01027236.1:398-2044(-)